MRSIFCGCLLKFFKKNGIGILMLSLFAARAVDAMEVDGSYERRRVISLAKFYDVYSVDVKDIKDKNFSNGNYIAGFDYENEACTMLMVNKKLTLRVVNSGGEYFFEGAPEKTPQFYGRRKERVYQLGEGLGKNFQMKADEENYIKLSWAKEAGDNLCKVTLKFIFIKPLI